MSAPPRPAPGAAGPPGAQQGPPGAAGPGAPAAGRPPPGGAGAAPPPGQQSPPPQHHAGPGAAPPGRPPSAHHTPAGTPRAGGPPPPGGTAGARPPPGANSSSPGQQQQPGPQRAGPPPGANAANPSPQQQPSSSGRPPAPAAPPNTIVNRPAHACAANHVMGVLLSKRPRIAWCMPPLNVIRQSMNTARYALEELAADAAARQAGAREVASSARSRGDNLVSQDASDRAAYHGVISTRARSAVDELPNCVPTTLLCLALVLRCRERLAKRAFFALSLRRAKRLRQRQLVTHIMKRNLSIVRVCFFRKWLRYHDRNAARRTARKRESIEYETTLRSLEARVQECSSNVAARKKAVEMHVNAFDTIVETSQRGGGPVNSSDAAYRDALVASFVEKERELQRDVMEAQDDLNDAVNAYFRYTQGSSSSSAVYATSHSRSLPASHDDSRFVTATPVVGGPARARTPTRTGGLYSDPAAPPQPVHAPSHVRRLDAGGPLGTGPVQVYTTTPRGGATPTNRELELQTQLNLATRALDEASGDARRYRELVQQQQQHSNVYGSAMPPPPPPQSGAYLRQPPSTPPHQQYSSSSDLAAVDSNGGNGSWPTPDAIAYSRHRQLLPASSPATQRSVYAAIPPESPSATSGQPPMSRYALAPQGSRPGLRSPPKTRPQGGSYYPAGDADLSNVHVVRMQ